MCGIVGVYSFDRRRPIDRSLLARQTDTIAHRGPDDGGLWVGDGVGLGHRRLSIIDVGGGHQPMWDIEERIGVIFNGEIYNYRELRHELEPKGHRFKTDSDTETIIHAYREWGDACIERFRGMFALAVFDRTKRTMLLARDRMGKKPLYWYRDRERLIFASEIKAIVEDPTVPRVVDPTSVIDFFAYNYVPGPTTIFQGIQKLPAGHLMVLSGEHQSVRSYWDVDFSKLDSSRSLEASVEALDETLQESVRLRLRSDVPLGAFLSGGIDSSLIVALMAEQSERAVKTHTIGFSEDGYDERGFAKETATLFSTDHQEKVVAVDALDVIDRLSWFYDEPFGDSSAVPTYYLSGATRDRVTVSLSGDGGDENFAGYRRYVFAMYEDEVRSRVPSLIRKGLVSPLARMYPKADYLPRFLRAKSTLTNLGVSHERAYFLSLTQKSYPHFLIATCGNGRAGISIKKVDLSTTTPSGISFEPAFGFNATDHAYHCTLTWSGARADEPSHDPGVTYLVSPDDQGAFTGGWADLTTYRVEFFYTPAGTKIRVWADEAMDGSTDNFVTEIVISDSSFPAGRFAFYSNSQAQVNFGDFTLASLDDFAADAGPDIAIQSGATASLSGSAILGVPDILCEWSDGATLVGSTCDLDVMPTVTTTYTLMVTDAFGRVATDQVVVNVTP